MSRLNQIIAVENGEKTRCQNEITSAYHLLQKGALLSGIARSYTPNEEGGDTLPAESTRVQVRAEEVIQSVAESMTRLFDITMTKDVTNCRARADVVVDGKIILPDVPVTYLLFLEKQLVNLHTFLTKLPTLDEAEEWLWSDAQNCWVTPPVETVRTKKIPRNHVKAEATDKHPAQVEVYHEDVAVGRWKTLKYSGALPVSRVKQLTARVIALQEAVKRAREEANMADAPPVVCGKLVFDFLLS